LARNRSRRDPAVIIISHGRTARARRSPHPTHPRAFGFPSPRDARHGRTARQREARAKYMYTSLPLPLPLPLLECEVCLKTRRQQPLLSLTTTRHQHQHQGGDAYAVHSSECTVPAPAGATQRKATQSHRWRCRRRHERSPRLAGSAAAARDADPHPHSTAPAMGRHARTHGTRYAGRQAGRSRRARVFSRRAGTVPSAAPPAHFQKRKRTAVARTGVPAARRGTDDSSNNCERPMRTHGPRALPRPAPCEADLTGDGWCWCSTAGTAQSQHGPATVESMDMHGSEPLGAGLEVTARCGCCSSSQQELQVATPLVHLVLCSLDAETARSRWWPTEPRLGEQAG
jgi:hypothetical protein